MLATGMLPSAPARASTPPANAPAVIERAAAVRRTLQADASPDSSALSTGTQLAWWGNWGNGGWHPGWHNWPNWHNWHNWPNWHNWHNWHNWRNY